MVSIAYQILRSEVRKAGRITPVAKKLGYARSSINLYLLGRYPAKIEAIERKIIGTFTNQILCPYINEVINKSVCEDIEQKSVNTNNPVLRKLQQYCEICPARHDLKEQFKEKIKEKNHE